MAINPSTNSTMAGRVTTPTADYPYGSAKDESSPGANDGTPYFKGRADDLFGWQQALLQGANIIPTGNAETANHSQYLDAMLNLPWLPTVRYQQGIVVRVDEIFYRSLIDPNLNNPPATNPSAWLRLASLQVWSEHSRYAVNDVVVYLSDLYISTVDNNTDQPPGAQWKALIAQDELVVNGIQEAMATNSDSNLSTSGLRVRDHGQTFRDVGFNVLPVVAQNTSTSLDENTVGKLLHRDALGSITLTLPSGTTGAVPPVGAVTQIVNENAAGLVTITAVGSLRHFNGSGTPATGSRRLRHGGICTVYKYASGEWWIWGIGVE